MCNGDCDDLDAMLGLPPSEVVGVALAGAGPTWIQFESQESTSGESAFYEVVAGDLTDLLESETYAAASCVGSFDDTPALDASPGPESGTGRYYLVRARNGCAVGGIGTFGDSTLAPDPRDDLDANGPCP